MLFFELFFGEKTKSTNTKIVVVYRSKRDIGGFLWYFRCGMIHSNGYMGRGSCL